MKFRPFAFVAGVLIGTFLGSFIQTPEAPSLSVAPVASSASVESSNPVALVASEVEPTPVAVRKETPPEPVVLPDEQVQKQIKHIKPGEHAYTVHWAMWVDQDGHCWLNPDYTIHTARRGTVSMLVGRHHQDGSYYVIREGDYRWTKVDEPSYVGQNGPWIPVSKILTR